MNLKINSPLICFVSLLFIACQNQTTTKTVNEAPEETTVAIPSLSSHLLSVEEAKTLISEGKCKLLDIRKPADYNKGHLPTAVNLWRKEMKNESYPFGGMAPTKEDFEKLLSEKGISNSDKIVLYDGKGCVDAARIWWLLKNFGYDNTAMIDGGINTWTLQGEPIDTIIYKYPTADFKFNTTTRDLCAQISDLEMASSNPDNLIIDTRTTDEYTGALLKKGTFRAGRIPSSIHIDWASAVDYGNTFAFKSLEDLKTIYKPAIAQQDKPIYTYCRSGVRSAHTLFVLTELLHLKNVKNYDGSWIEWSYHKELPIETGNKQEEVAL